MSTRSSQAREDGRGRAAGQKSTLLRVVATIACAVDGSSDGRGGSGYGWYGCRCAQVYALTSSFSSTTVEAPVSCREGKFGLASTGENVGAACFSTSDDATTGPAAAEDGGTSGLSCGLR